MVETWLKPSGKQLKVQCTDHKTTVLVHLITIIFIQDNPVRVITTGIKGGPLQYVYKFVVNYPLTMAPFISLNTTPLKIIGEFGLDRSSGSKRQPSCLKQDRILVFI